MTEHGLIPIPPDLRKNPALLPGARFQWEQISSREFRVTVEPRKPLGALAMLGCARKFRKDKTRRPTAEWMRILREGEET